MFFYSKLYLFYYIGLKKFEPLKNDERNFILSMSNMAVHFTLWTL